MSMLLCLFLKLFLSFWSSSYTCVRLSHLVPVVPIASQNPGAAPSMLLLFLTILWDWHVLEDVLQYTTDNTVVRSDANTLSST